MLVIQACSGAEAVPNLAPTRWITTAASGRVPRAAGSDRSDRTVRTPRSSSPARPRASVHRDTAWTWAPDRPASSRARRAIEAIPAPVLPMRRPGPPRHRASRRPRAPVPVPDGPAPLRAPGLRRGVPSSHSPTQFIPLNGNEFLHFLTLELQKHRQMVDARGCFLQSPQHEIRREEGFIPSRPQIPPRRGAAALGDHQRFLGAGITAAGRAGAGGPAGSQRQHPAPGGR